ncbi:hypothetical protein Tco_0048762, partial [Tanacetum coccineum]
NAGTPRLNQERNQERHRTHSSHYDREYAIFKMGGKNKTSLGEEDGIRPMEKQELQE